ncbi:hypothetical protein [Acidovorax sp. ACV01]|uniref:hypothetical protein n=1 Tax=Acidovorax sp. ACV01 TaxID=2769311 RepID=UPI001780F00B|nr:hypothetical protein [Acidovorax sp. ACV01]MBD9395759.1 hypothetical protein [Acidovorax sp. ACV01]
MIQTQAQANAYWADKEVKKWVVEFTAGPHHWRRTARSLVSARSTARAQAAGIQHQIVVMNNTWVRRASATTVRLATAQDLGCVYVCEKGGAA